MLSCSQIKKSINDFLEMRPDSLGEILDGGSSRTANLDESAEDVLLSDAIKSGAVFAPKVPRFAVSDKEHRPRLFGSPPSLRRRAQETASIRRLIFVRDRLLEILG